MKNLFGCLLMLIALPVLAVIAYFLFNIFLYFLPLLVVAAIVLALPYFIWLCYKRCSPLVKCGKGCGDYLNVFPAADVSVRRICF